MRQTLSTAATAVIVSLLTLTVAGATAQSEPAKERTVEPTGTNADRVDGKHAVGYTNKKANESGTGLGLAISRELAERMGGRLELVPVAKGAKFRLIIPMPEGPPR